MKADKEPVYEPGTLEHRMQRLSEFAEAKCGHSPVSSAPFEAAIEQRFAELESIVKAQSAMLGEISRYLHSRGLVDQALAPAWAKAFALAEPGAVIRFDKNGFPLAPSDSYL